MTGLPPPPVPQRKRDDLTPWLIVLLIVVACAVIGGVSYLASRGWPRGSAAVVPVPAASPFRSDVAVTLNSVNHSPLPAGHPGGWVICNVTVTNHTTGALRVFPEVIGAEIDGEIQYSSMRHYLTNDPKEAEFKYGQQLKMLAGNLKPGESVTGDVIYSGTTDAQPGRVGYHPGAQ